MKRIFVLLVIVISLFSLTALASGSPTDSLLALVNHLRALDFDAASQLLADPRQGEFLKEAMKDPQQAAVLKKLLTTVEVAFGQEEIKGEEATVVITLHSVKGEALFNLNAYLAAKLALLPEGTEESAQFAAMEEALSQWEWKGMAPHSHVFRYHLVKVEGVWKLDHAKSEAL